MPRPVTFWFDFVSPYSYLALTQAERFAAENDVSWTMRPIFYAAVLDATELLGPAEVPIKREYTMRDLIRAAELLGVPLVGPPAHPFNSLLALRAAVLAQDDPRAALLCAELSGAAWARGRSLEDPAVVAEAAERAGCDGGELVARATTDEAKSRLKANTAEAIAAGVFGVPTLRWEGELFWGHDRMEHLAARLGGRLGSPEARAREVADRPRGADRPGTPYRPA